MANMRFNFKRIVCVLAILVSLMLFAVGCASDQAEEKIPEGAETVAVTFIVDGEIYETGLFAVEYRTQQIENTYKHSQHNNDYIKFRRNICASSM